MAQRKNYPYHTPWSDEGWVLVFVLLFLTVIQGLIMASLSMVTYHLKSSTAFYHIIRNTHFSTQGGKTPMETQTMLMAPEGWDYLCFSTVLREVQRGGEQSYSWRADLREVPMVEPGDVMLTSSRPHIIVIVDDSQTMNSSCDRDYKAESLYLKRTSGEIVHVSDVSEIAESVSAPEGSFFTGRYGNTTFRAPKSETSHGAMSIWTFAYSYAHSLIDSLELCEVAIMSTSRGMIQQFSHDRQILTKALEGIHPTSAEARLAETLYQATRMFPQQCATERHILLVSGGVAINDGHLPEWLKDFDHDENVSDTAIREVGSHCLDDVSAYAFSQGVRVHTVGPDTAFLQSVATKGGGLSMPSRDALVPTLSFVCQPIVILQGQEYIAVHTLARFDPPWLRNGSSTSLRTGVIDPLTLVAYPNLSIRGLAEAVSLHGSSLFCTTSRDQILKIAMPSGEIEWLIEGIGGTVHTSGDRIIAGPISNGYIACLNQQPSILWNERGQKTAVSESSVYISSGSSITAHHLDDGASFAGFDTNHTITVLRYVIGTGMLMAGTGDGLIYLFTRGLEPQGFIPTGIGDAITDIRPFTWCKKTYFIATSRGAATCCTSEGPLWYASLVEGYPVSCIIMDSKAYLCTWQEGDPCGGIDTGTSMLIILDSLTGQRVHVKTLFTGKAFGPSIDLTTKRMVYISWNGQVHEEDISTLEGITWCAAGRRMLRQSE
jgi:hypothetical protein